MMPGDREDFEKAEKFFRENAEKTADWPFASPIPKKEKKKK